MSRMAVYRLYERGICACRNMRMLVYELLPINVRI